ncbi:MAG: hypothetical protein HUU37_06360 [Bdellovibrionales bacterium]|nr:hypothetical protein [Bdellovibrionales bacterium]
MIQNIRFSVLVLMVAGGLSGCASLLDFAPDDSAAADYDRGYSAEAVEEDEEDVADRRVPVGHESNEEEDAGRPAGVEPRPSRAIQSRDVILGMTRGQVLRSWGEPSVRESAGRGNDGHERWTYRSRMTLGGGDRVVIFENGRVAGWYR